MNRNIGIIIAIAMLMFGGAWLWMSLQTKATETQLTRMHAALDEVEQDMGTFDPESSRAVPVTQRVQKVTRQMNRKVEEQRRLLDSLTRAEREDLGDHTLNDSSARVEKTPRYNTWKWPDSNR